MEKKQTVLQQIIEKLLADSKYLNGENDRKEDRIVGQYLKTIADDLAIEYLPLFETMDKELRNRNFDQPYTFEKLDYEMIKAIISHIFFGKSWEKISQKFDFMYHIDKLHMNDKGADSIFSLISNFLETN